MDIHEQMKQNVRAVKEGREIQDPAPAPAPAPTDDNPIEPENIQPKPKEADDGYSDIERQAIADGWRPKEEWAGDPDDWVSAKEFNSRKSLFAKIDHEVKARKSMERELHRLKDSFDTRIGNVVKVTRQQVIDELNAKKKEAVEEADYGKVQEIDKMIEETNEQFSGSETRELNDPPPIRAPIRDFMEENEWFTKDQEMTEFALEKQQEFLYELGKDASEISDYELSKITKRTVGEVKKKFPSKFDGSDNPSPTRERPKAPAVEDVRPSKTAKRRFNQNNLSAEEKHVMEQMKFYAGMQEEDYIQAIADIDTAEKRRTVNLAPYKSRGRKKA